MNRDLANFSADLKRVAYWIYNGQDKLVEETLDRCKKNYKDINPKIGCYKNIWDEIENIEKEKSKERSAEKALTASIILINIS